MMYRFGSFALDLATCELRREDEPIALQPRVFSMLRYLIEHRDRVVGKEELIDALWRGQQVNGVAVPWTINRARTALGKTPAGQNFIETVRGHGYRFVGDVCVSEERAQARPPSVVPSAQAALAATPESPFVGRDYVMVRMTAALNAAASGRGGLFLLSGEAGIGKTRCANEFAALAARRGVPVWRGRCFEAQVAPAFWPFVQILRAASTDQSSEAEARREAERLLCELEPQNQNDLTAAELLPRGDMRFWILDRLSTWLCTSAKHQVRIVEIDDIHSTDDGSLQALSLIRPMLAEARLLLVLTARDVGPRVERSAAALSVRLRPSEHVELSGLRSEDIRAYLTTLFGDENATLLSEPLAARTAGNPLFLHEATQILRARYEQLGEVGFEDLGLPHAVKELVSARFSALDPQTRTLLEAASVVGEDFTLPLVQRATAFDAQQALSALQVALQGNIVLAKSDQSGYRFAHPLMREVLYASLAPGTRAKWHAAVGCALEAMGQIEPPLMELAHHFHHAAMEPYYERAARYGRLAGGAALRALSYAEAVQFYGWSREAHAHLGSTNLVDACELLLDSAAALSLAGDRQEARDRCERAIELARSTQQPELLIRAAWQLRPSVWLATIPDPLAVRALEDALSMLPETASAARSRAYGQLAVLPPYSLTLERSQQMSAEAVRLASETNDPQLVLEAQRSCLYGLSGPDSIEDQLRLAETILRSDFSPAAYFSADAQFAKYHAFLQRADRAAAERTLQEMRHIARTQRLPRLAWHCERLHVQSLLSAGRLTEVEALFDELFARATRSRLPLADEYRAVLAQVLRVERTGRRLPTSDQPVRTDPGWLQSQPGYRATRVLLALERGESVLARAEFDDLARDDFAVVKSDAFGLFALVRLSTAVAALDRREAALSLHALLEPHADRVSLSAFAIAQGSVAYYVALLDQYLGRTTQARTNFERAIEVNARAGHELARLRACLGLADLLSKSRVSSDNVKARALLAEASSTAQQLGARPIEQKALELSNRMGAAPSSDAARGDLRRARARPKSDFGSHE